MSLSFGNEKELDGAINYIKDIITKKENSSLRVKGCEVSKSKWINLLLTKTSFKEKISFNKQCHLEGSFVPEMDSFFMVPLKIQDKKFTNIKYLSKLEVKFTDSMNLTLTIKDGELTDKDKKVFKFNASQTFKLDPFNKKDPIKKSKGGILNVQYLKAKKSLKI